MGTPSEFWDQFIGRAAILQGNGTDGSVGESGRQVATADIHLSRAGRLRDTDAARQIAAGERTRLLPRESR